MSTQERDLLDQFIRLEWMLMRYRIQHFKAHGPMGDPHRGQGRLLALLKLHPEISQKELSHILAIRSQSLCELLGKLEQKGYVTRSPSEKDRRVLIVRLTEAGARAAEQNQQQMDSDDLFGCLSEEEQDTLGTYLERIIATLEPQLGEPPHGFDPHHAHGFDAPHGFDGRACEGHPMAWGGFPHPGTPPPPPPPPHGPPDPDKE